jgi:hypothetical protein
VNTYDNVVSGNTGPGCVADRSKAQTEAGIAPYVQDGAMAYGTRPHAQLQRTASDVPAGDEIDLLATPAPAHVP